KNSAEGHVYALRPGWVYYWLEERCGRPLSCAVQIFLQRNFVDRSWRRCDGNRHLLFANRYESGTTAALLQRDGRAVNWQRVTDALRGDANAPGFARASAASVSSFP